MKKKLQDEMRLAMKAKDQRKLETIRILLSEIQYAEMQKKTDLLPDDEVIAVIQREVKKRKEELEFAEKANRADAKEKVLTEIAVLESFLPKQLSKDELKNILAALKAATPGLNVGAAMKHLRDNYAGQFDGKAASEAAKEVL